MGTHLKVRTYQLTRGGTLVATITVPLTRRDRANGEGVDDEVLEAFQAPADLRKGIGEISFAFGRSVHNSKGHFERPKGEEGLKKTRKKRKGNDTHAYEIVLCC